MEMSEVGGRTAACALRRHKSLTPVLGSTITFWRRGGRRALTWTAMDGNGRQWTARRRGAGVRQSGPGLHNGRAFVQESSNLTRPGELLEL